jgi:uncharacterized protein YdeI (YjbR/CyaY-like superfamily)
MTDAYPELTFESQEQWRAWLSEHHATVRGVWVTTYKKASGKPHLRVDDLIDEALAHGWVDSRPRTLDDQRSQRLVTPRRPTSNWSRVNKQRIERLLAAGRMTPSGLTAVEVAKRNGTWTALDAVEDLHEPGDLRDALDTTPGARRHWDAFPRSTKRAILEWIGNAKTPATRAKRITETATKAAQNLRANQWRQPKSTTTRPPPATPPRSSEDVC